jgi:hypothetical protein
LVSELSVIAGQEKVMLDECRELLAMAAKLEVLTKKLLLKSDHKTLKFENTICFSDWW